MDADVRGAGPTGSTGLARVAAAVLISLIVNTGIAVALVGFNCTDSHKPGPGYAQGRIFSAEMTVAPIEAPEQQRDDPVREEIPILSLDQTFREKTEMHPLALNVEVTNVRRETDVLVPKMMSQGSSSGIGDMAGSREGSAAEGGSEAGSASQASVIATDSVPVADSVDEPPVEFDCPLPEYPRFAIRNKIEGYVRARLLIGEDGHVLDVDIVEVVGSEEFRTAVLKVVSNWVFTPARNNGKAVKVWGCKTLRFKLEK
ncbi:MAG: energy transducer TonB [Candidatus Brocadiia bacterium]